MRETEDQKARTDDAADPASTAELVIRARHGDQQAFDSLFARHYPALRRWASGRLPLRARELADTDDLVQEALLQTFRRLGELEARGAGSLYAYLRRAVLNKIRDHIRSGKRRPDHTGLQDVEAGEELSPLEQAIGREALERYERALARLRPVEQEAVIGRVELGFTYEELAQSMGSPSSEAARKAAHRALVRLAEEMEHDAP
jgi:RNA polymerase sigma-70 factor (ECF subfamily)